MILARAVFTSDLVAGAGLALSLAGLAAWVGLMRSSAPLLGAVGPICGHLAGQAHCPACYAAASAALMGLAVSALALAPRRSRVSVKA